MSLSDGPTVAVGRVQGNPWNGTELQGWTVSKPIVHGNQTVLLAAIALAMKPTLLPVISYLGPVFVYVLTGSVFVDLYFSTGGLGQAYVNSALTRDYAVLLGVTILYGALTVIVNLVTDLAYAWFDPKIRY